MSIFKIRPHHGLCIAFFEGKGYSPEFVRNMTEKIQFLNTHNPEIELVLHTDIICSACPHCLNELCESHRKVLNYDRQVLKFCNFTEHQVLFWKEFQSQIFGKILLAKKFPSVCPQCQWQEICFLTFYAKYDKIKS